MGRRTNREKSEKSKFGKKLKKYVLVLSVFCIMFLVYVMNTLYQYEASFTENYMAEYVKNLTSSANKGNIGKYCNTNNITINNLDNNKNNYQKSLEQTIKTSEISYKLNSPKNAEEPIYGIYANNEKIMEITLKVKKQHKRLGLFTYPTWEIKDCKLGDERGLYYYDILVPNNYSVEINGTKLDDSYISESIADEGYNVLSKYVKLPQLVNYKLDNFVSEPRITIADENGQSVEYSNKDHKVELSNAHRFADTYEDAKQYLAEELDVLDIAEKWSLFLTDDLTGNRHGFNTLTKYLIADTELYNMAYSWATSIDITFTSMHTLKNPTFTNTKVSDFEIYGENAFTCTVYLEKNMRIANGKDKVDVMHDKLYFVRYDDTNDGKDNPTWKMVEMKSIANK